MHWVANRTCYAAHQHLKIRGGRFCIQPGGVQHIKCAAHVQRRGDQGYAFHHLFAHQVGSLDRKLPQNENNIKIEASISLRRRDEEVKVHGEPDCWNLG